MNPDEIKEKAHALAAAGASADEVEQFVRSATSQPAEPKLPTKLEIAKRNAAMPHPEDLEDPDPTYAQQALGGIAALGSHIPGAEAAQAGMRALVRGQPYEEALSDIRGAENSANPWVRRYNSLAGGAVAAAAAPRGTFTNPLGTGGSVALQGARFGAAEGLLSADPQSGQDRLLNSGKSAALTAITAKVLGEFLPNTVRALRAKSLGTTALGKTAQMEANDAAAYGKAAAEGVGLTHQQVTAALNHPTVKPFASEIRNSPVFKGADDATILREAYKLMTEKQQTLAQRVVNSSDYKAGSALEKEELTQGKRQLLDAADNIMPSLRPAVYGHATAKGELDAFRSGADATARIARGATVAGRKLTQNSPEAFKKSIHLMSEQEAKSALEGVLGQLQAKASLSVNPLKGFGVPKAASSINRLAPYIEALDQRAGNAGTLRRALAIALASQANGGQ
jgi:hypothetical protein